jgi:hypothetical protein
MNQVVNVSEIVLKGDNKGALNALNGVVARGKESEMELANTSSRMSKALGSVATVLTGIGASAALGFGVMIKNAIDTADRFDEMSQRIGISVETLSAFDYAAKLSGVNTELFEASLKKFNMALYDARVKGSEAEKILSALGVTVKDGNGIYKDAETVLLQVSDKFTKVVDPVEKAEVAVKLFGKSGADMVPFLDQGSKGLETMRKEAERLGIVLDADTAAKAGDFNDSLDRMTASLNGLAYSAMPVLLDTFTNSIVIIQKVASGIMGIVDNVTTFIKKIDEASARGSGWEKFKRENTVPVNSNNWGVKLFGFDPSTPPTPVLPDFVTKGQGFGRDNSEETITVNTGGKGGGKVKTDKDLERYWDTIGDNYATWLGEVQSRNMTQRMAFYDIQGMTEEDFQGKSLDRFKSMEMLKVDVTKISAELQLEIMEQQAAREEELFQYRLSAFANYSGSMANLFDVLYNISNEKFKALFHISKYFALGEAGINTWKAVSGALAMQPWTPYNYVYAAGALTSGIATAAKILTTQPGSLPNGQIALGVSSLSTPTLRESNNSNTSQSMRNIIVNVTVQGSAYNLAELGRTLAPEIRKALGDGKK